MLVIGRAARAAAAAFCAVAFVAACSSGDDSPSPDSEAVTAAKMRSSLLKAEEIGPTWAAPDASAAPPQLSSICGGTNAAPALPGSPEVVSSPLADEGTTGAQSLVQTGLVYPDAAAAQAAQVAFRVVADACPPTFEQESQDTGEAQEPAYTETVKTSDYSQGGWSGFVVVRHKQYEPAHPSTADTAVVVLTKANAVLFDTYAIYRLATKGSTPSANPNFSTDWQKLVGTVVGRVDG